MSRQADLEKEITLWQRRLQKLREQKATFGAMADPSLDIQIEDIEATIEQRQAELAELKREDKTPAPATITPSPIVSLSPGAISEPDPELAALRAIPRIFLCHASEDKPRVKELYHLLKEAGYSPWLDKYDLLPGQRWRPAIRKVITNHDNLILVCLSQHSITKRGVVQQEIKWALDILDQMPEDTIYLIPVRLEECQTPDRLTDVHWVNLFEADGFVKLKQALDFEISKRKAIPESTSTSMDTSKYSIDTEPSPTLPPAPVEVEAPILPETPAFPLVERQEESEPPRKKKLWDYLRDPLWQGISALIAIVALIFGVYTFYIDSPSTPLPSLTQDNASPNASSATATPDPACEAGIAPALEELDNMVIISATNLIMGDNQGERPKHQVLVDTFSIDRFEVTNLQYRDFISATGHPAPPEWDGLNFPPGKTAFQPVVNVTWFDSRDYCAWAGKRLPTEAEWELACRGPAQHLYPWGQEPDSRKANTQDIACGRPLTIGRFSPGGDSLYYGVADMVGNAIEWVNSISRPYPYLNDGRENSSDMESERVYRGGSWQTEQAHFSCTVRGSSPPEAYLEDRGFRCAKSVSLDQ